MAWSEFGNDCGAAPFGSSLHGTVDRSSTQSSMGLALQNQALSFSVRAVLLLVVRKKSLSLWKSTGSNVGVSGGSSSSLLSSVRESSRPSDGKTVVATRRKNPETLGAESEPMDFVVVMVGCTCNDVKQVLIVVVVADRTENDKRPSL